MRSTVFTSLGLVLAVGGCSLSRADLLDAPAPSAPTRAYHRTSKERLATRDLTPFFREETRHTVATTLRRSTLSRAIHAPVSTPQTEEPDPIRGAFDDLPVGHRWMPREFLPAGGTLEVTRVRRSRLHLRAWHQDEKFRGGGLGVTLPLRAGWHAAAEFGVDPMRSPTAGGIAVVAGFGLRL